MKMKTQIDLIAESRGLFGYKLVSWIFTLKLDKHIFSVDAHFGSESTEGLDCNQESFQRRLARMAANS